MKTLLAIAALSFSLGQAHADERETIVNPELFTRSATIESVKIDPLSFLAKKGLNSGEIRVNAVTRKVNFVLYGQFVRTPEGIEIHPMRRQFDLPLVSFHKDEHGVVTYVARRDERPVDGLLHELIVVDYSMDTREVIPGAFTTLEFREIYFNHQEGKEVTRTSTFTAGKLKNIGSR